MLARQLSSQVEARHLLLPSWKAANIEKARSFAILNKVLSSPYQALALTLLLTSPAVRDVN